MDTQSKIIYETDRIRIIYIADLLPTHHKKKHRLRSIHDINRVVWHHTAGSTRKKSISGPLATARYHIHKNWPGIAYHFYIPFSPNVKSPEVAPAIVYQCLPLNVWSYHTGPTWNQFGIGVACQGWFFSSENPRVSILEPSDYQLQASEQLWIFLKEQKGLTNRGLFGHYHAGKNSCPGDTLQNWIEKKRGE